MVVIGGGTGLSTLLRGLKGHLGGDRLESVQAVVSVADDGGSSGRLRRDFAVPPPGDIRNCLVALSAEEDLLARLFQYRFPAGEGLSGHSFGNLLLTALTGITGDFYEAVEAAERFLNVQGRILPSTLQDVRLQARGRSGRTYDGESAIGSSSEPLASLALDPPAPPAFPLAVAALRKADLIVLGPGSLYTSLLANLLIPGIRRAVEESPARVVLPLNLMTQPGETEGMSGRDHVEAIRTLAGADLVDVVLVSSTRLPAESLELYELQGSRQVVLGAEEAAELGAEWVAADLVTPAGMMIRHDPAKLARAILDLLPEGGGESRSEGDGGETGGGRAAGE